ncbi:hypothetical protein [Limnochorda pilosa]|uniref:Outer membrane protein beta-barrel domain-containing protein n=1 Tax=Limnochorda pilosa TaxID=1555112 RepID=A0A0K2SQA6_LIMPI|nr:hypothetical protein [Limnochorda pilosa]BAS29310.1 hypothetical protein LIP_3498 [Limnochorda pilosa]
MSFATKSSWYCLRLPAVAAALAFLVAVAPPALQAAAEPPGQEPSVTEGGSYSGISLAYMDTAAINTILDRSGWTVPRFDQGPLFVWTSGGGGQVGPVRLGFTFGFGTRSQRDNSQETASSLTVYRGDLRADYVLPTGLGRRPDRPDGALALFAGAGLGVAYGALRIEQPLPLDPGEEVPAFRESDRWLITAGPALGILFTPSSLAYVELSASYTYPFPLGGPRKDEPLDPGGALLRGLTVNLGLMLADF